MMRRRESVTEDMLFKVAIHPTFMQHIIAYEYDKIVYYIYVQVFLQSLW